MDHVATSRNMSPHVATCCHLPPHVATCCHMSPHVAIYRHMLPHVTTCRHMSPLVTTYPHMSPHVVTCCHMSPVSSHFTNSPRLCPESLVRDGRPRRFEISQVVSGYRSVRGVKIRPPGFAQLGQRHNYTLVCRRPSAPDRPGRGVSAQSGDKLIHTKPITVRVRGVCQNLASLNSGYDIY